MPVEAGGLAHNLVRGAKAVRGEVRFQMRCEPRFDYARASHTAERRSDTEVLFFGRSGDGELVLRLRSSVPMRLENGAALAEFTLGADTSAWFVLEVVLAQEPSPSEQPDYQSHAFKQTVNFWRRWVARSSYGGRWREMVNRSALTLKLLTSRQHGSIVAAPTFGLPETIGGGRNWDYRYTWIRDSSFTLYGLMRLGYTHEAAAFMRWVMARCSELEPDGSLQIMYGLDGRRPRHPARDEAVLPCTVGALVRDAGYDLSGRLHPLLGPDAAHVHPARRRHHARCRGAADAARPLRVPHRPAVALDPARDRGRAGERLAGLSLSPCGRILRRAHGGGRHVLDVLLLVRRVPLPDGGPAQGAVLLREDARVRQSPGVVRRGARPPGAAPRQLPAGVHTSGAHQRRLRFGPPALGRRPRQVIVMAHAP